MPVAAVASMRATTLARGIAARAGISATPISVGFEITHLCNLDCEYCDRHAQKPNEMTREQILTALAELHEIGMRHVSLDGGEPLTHRHIDEVVAFLVQRRVRVYMNSNGILVPKKLASVRLLGKLKISLDGLEREHDRMRGAGAFKKAIDGARAARDAGVPVELTCVVGRHNADGIPELLDFAEKSEFRVVFQPARPSLFQGAQRDDSAWALEPETLRRVFSQLEAAKRRGSRAVANRWASLFHFRKFPADADLPCAAGWINATLDPEGYLYHCGQFGRDDRSHNVVVLGARAAFEGLTRRGCRQCWCARVVEENYAWGGHLHRMLPPSPARPSEPPPAAQRRLPIVA
jgi:MoaA/NifB/PqqE/SkfB family radical SAM enzyme